MTKTETDPSLEDLVVRLNDLATRLNDAAVVIHRLFEAVVRVVPSEADNRLVDQALSEARKWMDGEQP